MALRVNCDLKFEICGLCSLCWYSHISHLGFQKLVLAKSKKIKIYKKITTCRPATAGKKWRNIQKGCTTVELNVAIRPHVLCSFECAFPKFPMQFSLIITSNSMDHLKINRGLQCVQREREREEPNGFPKETSWLRLKLKLLGPKFWALINNDGLTTTK